MLDWFEQNWTLKEQSKRIPQAIYLVQSWFSWFLINVTKITLTHSPHVAHSFWQLRYSRYNIDMLKIMGKPLFFVFFFNIEVNQQIKDLWL